MTPTTEETIMAEADSETNDFRAWMKALGFNAKQVTAAGELVGMSSSLAGHSSRGLRELTHTERLAMSAATAGLPAWTPETSAEIEAVRGLHAVLKSEVANIDGDAGAESEAVRTIKALIRSEAMRIATGKANPQSDDPETDRAILALLRAAARDASAR